MPFLSLPLSRFLWCAVLLGTALLCACQSRRLALAEPGGVTAAVASPTATPGHTRPPVPALNTPPGAPLFREATLAEARSLSAGLRRSEMRLASWTDLEPALQRSLQYAESWSPEERAVEHSGRRITWGEVTASLLLLKSLLPRLDTEPELLSRHFQWLHVAPGVRFTGYYSPVVPASRTRKPGYEHPIYRLPPEIAPALAHCLPMDTCPEEAFAQIIRPETPYHGRAAIDLDGALRGRGLEMAWLQHPFDTYLLMLEGSGILRFDDGTRRAALFAGLNGVKGKSMAGYLIRTGQLPRREATISGMRRWWDAHPERRRAFLEAASGYAFFQYGAENPRGTAGGDLTPWVSMAVDERVLPLGGIVAYDLPAPGRAVRGLGFAHDTGSAIKMRRIDMYTGEGEEAKKQALNIYTQGRVWLLLAKAS